MSIDVKICGIREPRHGALAAERGARWVGLVFAPASPRHVSLDKARAIVSMLPDSITVVGVTVDADDEGLRAIIGTGVGALQLHGEENPARVAEVRRMTEIPVIKAVGIGTADDLERAEAFQGAADMLLFDARPPPGADRPGGHARTFDWRMLSGRSPLLPWILSGGLHPENVANAIALTAATAVDVSSGVETSPGEKSGERIGLFLDSVRKIAP